MRRSFYLLFFTILAVCRAFSICSTSKNHQKSKLLHQSSSSKPQTDTFDEDVVVTTVEEASRILEDWDRLSNPDNKGFAATSMEDLLLQLEPSVRLLSQCAAQEREADSTQGRCMLGICASSAAEALETLKSWVTSLKLPRGLLHGMDKDGVPIELNGPVYVKYNSGGVYTFTDIRKSGLGFDALWKPGDALMEPYEDGNYRGVYFQVELSDGKFRQYLMPMDLFQL